MESSARASSFLLSWVGRRTGRFWAGPGRCAVGGGWLLLGLYWESDRPTVRRLIDCRGEARGYAIPPGCWDGAPSGLARTREP